MSAQIIHKAFEQNTSAGFLINIFDLQFNFHIQERFECAGIFTRPA